MTDLTKLAPPEDLNDKDKNIIFQHFLARLARYRNIIELYGLTEYQLSLLPRRVKEHRLTTFKAEINKWASSLLEHAWVVCQASNTREKCPQLDPLTDTSTGRLPRLPPVDRITGVMNSILFLSLTTSKQYSAHTRAFLSTFATLDEHTVVTTLKNPDQALKDLQKRAGEAKVQQADKGKTMRIVGLGLGAIAGGAIIGLTGGLAAPLVGAGVTTVLGWVGIGGTAAGLLASGLASSSIVCGALFGVYGAKSTAGMVERYTREVRDIDILPVNQLGDEQTLAVRLCVSGWLSSPADVTAPWKVFGGEDTFALQWEVEALEALSNALSSLIKDHAMKYIKIQVIRQTAFAALMASLMPTMVLLKIGQIIDNPWMNTKSLAVKTGAVLGDLIAHRDRAFGSRPLTLVGYSHGSLVIFEALKVLASLPPSQTAHLIQDVFLFGSPVPSDAATWASIRRVVCGRLVNGYSANDYVLAVLSRASDASWGVAGLQEVQVQGVENIKCDDVDGHTKWPIMIGRCLQLSNAPGVKQDEVYKQMVELSDIVKNEADMSPEEADRLSKTGLKEL